MPDGFDVNSELESQGTVDPVGAVHPAWNELLAEVPQELHPKLQPHLQKVSSNYDKAIQKTRSEYEPWKPLISSGVDPETVDFGVKLLSALESDPKAVYEQIGKYYNLVQESLAEPDKDSNNPATEDPYQQQLAELKRNQEIIAQNMVKAREAELVQKAEAELDAEFKGLEKKYGSFDEEYVLAMMQNGYDSEAAVKRYHQFVETKVKTYQPKPLIMGSGGGIPGQGINPRTLDDKGRKALVVSMLEQAARERRQ